MSALSEDRERLWAQVNGVDFLTLDEKRALVGYGAVQGADVPTTDLAVSDGQKYNHFHNEQDGRFAVGGSGTHDGNSGGGTSVVRSVLAGHIFKHPIGLTLPTSGILRSGDYGHTFRGGLGSGVPARNAGEASATTPQFAGAIRGIRALGSVLTTSAAVSKRLKDLDTSKPKPGGSFGGGGASRSWGQTAPQKRAKPRTTQPGPSSSKLEDHLPNEPVHQQENSEQRTAKRKTTTAQHARISKPPKERVSTTKVTANGYQFEIDNNGRTVRVHGELKLDPTQKRSRSAQQNAGKPDRLPDDHGGHLIAREFGGPEMSYNHFAQNARFNSSDYRKLENVCKGDLKAGKSVKVDIQPIYKDESKRPNIIKLQYFANGKTRHRIFSNLKKGEVK